jgi:transposase-like protein
MTLWQNMTSEEKYRVVKMARSGEMQIKEICEAFGVTRQTLNKAIEKVEQAALTALEPKSRGRKPKTEEAQKITELSKKHASLEKEVDHWKTRYEVAQKYISIMHEEDEVEERRERNRRKRERKQQKKKRDKTSSMSRKNGGTGKALRVVSDDNGSGDGDENEKPESVD